MKMVFAVDAEAPELFNWPLGNNGKISFKLDRLAPANWFAHEDAHDALADVEATIFIFKKIKEGVPDLFEKLIGELDTYALWVLFEVLKDISDKNFYTIRP